ncbi:type II secretion system F family protein [Salinisphaera sp. Q1T1-3]|uniref:type II secretion system F family protein n=1 Tax=Salinisphaera sp. Q1T1-3 TaxID=2321229 RepID=UPI000E7576B5|nr:type II secretion system F family protein [Salinisphaera sp. Q1T1-3]RJS92198.1 type II secretion system F family protein [Salinisphaera sp. Q1T1-3]
MAQAETDNQLFFWIGTDRNGERIKGQTEGPNEAMVRALLRRQQINPIRVRKKTTLFGLGKKRRKKITSGDIAVFSRQLATMLSAGVPLVQSLDIVAGGATNPALRALVRTIRDDIENGMPLAEALARHPRHFDDLYVNLVAAGERSGALESLLDKIATYKEKTEAIKAKVRKALFYPSAVIAVAIVVMGILLYFVVPQFQSLFAGFGADLPAFTLMVIGLSHGVQRWWWLILLAVGGAAYGFITARRRSRRFRRGLDRAALRLPVIGNIVYDAAVARFSRTLATMFAAGVPLVEALDSVARAAGNVVFEDAIFQMRNQVSSGQSLALATENTGRFPSMAQQMIKIGEEAGALDAMCSRVADFYEAEVDARVDVLSSLLEPLIMAVIGVLVGGLVIAMYLPIFKLGSVV